MPSIHAFVNYPSGKTVEVKNLGYLTRNWKQIKSIQVSTFKGRDDVDAFMSVDFKDGRIYTTGYMSKEVLRDFFLNRSIFYGLPVYWFGEQTTITKEWCKSLH